MDGAPVEGTIRVLLADDPTLFREGLKGLIASYITPYTPTTYFAE